MTYPYHTKQKQDREKQNAAAHSRGILLFRNKKIEHFMLAASYSPLLEYHRHYDA